MSEPVDGRLLGDRLLEGCTALVTGRASGVGRGIAEALHERDAAVAVTGLTDVECEEAHAAGFLAHPLDVWDRQACGGAVARTASDLGELSMLTLNAEVYPQVRITDVVDEDTSAIFGVNVIDAIHMAQVAAAALRESGRGRVVVTSSITGNVTGYPGWSHYGATKAAQMGFVHSVVMGLAKDGITINAVIPDNVIMPGLVVLGEEYIRRMATTVPLGYLSEPRDVGEMVTFFVSDGVCHITSQAITVDGGQILPGSPKAIADT